MQKTILITGSTDGIGFETAKTLVKDGHNVLVHGRNEEKLMQAVDFLKGLSGGGQVSSYLADLSELVQVEAFAQRVLAEHNSIDALINNAGVYVVPNSVTSEGLDTRFVVNTIAPFLLTKKLLPIIPERGRVVNLSSAAQAPFSPEFLTRPSHSPDNQVYAQSKLAITMWTHSLAVEAIAQNKVIVAVNPKSLLGSKMVKEAYGISGGSLSLGADILIRASLSQEFANASGLYFDNDIGQFAQPYADATNMEKCLLVQRTIEQVLESTSAKFA